LNLKEEELGEMHITAMKGVGLAAVLAVVGFIVWKALAPVQFARDMAISEQSRGFGGVKAVGNVLYRSAVLPFEVTSLLLLVAVVSAVVIAKGKI
jgi:NADH-quinone oxidoreductase subunit J